MNEWAQVTLWDIAAATSVARLACAGYAEKRSHGWIINTPSVLPHFEK